MESNKKQRLKSLEHAYRLVNTGCVMLVSVGDGENDNLFAVTWNMPVRKSPGMVAILSGKGHYSYGFIAKTGEFGLNVMDASHVDAVFGCGSTTGHKVKDKFDLFGLTRTEAEHIKPPLVAEAVASLECRVAAVHDMGASSLLVADIMGCVVDADHFIDGNWCFENGLQLLHHMGGPQFCVSDREIKASPPAKK